MKHAVVVDCVRTPIGRVHKEKGFFRDVRSDDLAVEVVRALVERSGIEPDEIEDVVLGNTQQQGEQGFNAARAVALMAGLPMHTGGARSTASAVPACRRSTRHRTRSWPVLRTFKSWAVWSTCSTFPWTRVWT